MDDLIFKKAMGRFATGVTVITTSIHDTIYGMTANAFMSVSMSPRLVLVSISKKANIKQHLEKSGKFAVSILTKEQQEISKYFAGQEQEKRQINFQWFDDLPIIENSIANITCDVYDVYEVGDHILYIGEVRDIMLQEGEPLTFFEGKYKQLG